MTAEILLEKRERDAFSLGMRYDDAVFLAGE